MIDVILQNHASSTITVLTLRRLGVCGSSSRSVQVSSFKLSQPLRRQSSGMIHPHNCLFLVTPLFLLLTLKTCLPFSSSVLTLHAPTPLRLIKFRPASIFPSHRDGLLFKFSRSQWPGAGDPLAGLLSLCPSGIEVRPPGARRQP
jgi:hypothetical protein